MKTKDDVTNAFRAIRFVERTAALAEKYRRIPGKKEFKPRKDKVFELIKKNGYDSYFKYGSYYICNEADEEHYFIEIYFISYWICISYRYYENEKTLYDSSIGWIQGSVADNNNYCSGYPVAYSYDDLEIILSEAIKIYDDSIKTLNGTVQTDKIKIPDIKNLICINTTRDDVLETLRKIKFFERSTQMCKDFNKLSAVSMPKVEKDKIFEIIRAFGYEPGYDQSWFLLKNQFIGPYRFEMEFKLKYFVGDFSWNVYEEGVMLYGGVWSKMCRELAEGRSYNPPYKPSFANLDEFKKLIAIAFEMFEDFKQTLCESKGIEYTRITGETE